MISIIVPVYNTEKYLHRCVDSILEQTYTDFELLLINDGSTDLSGVICDEYAMRDSRVRVFHKENGGVSSARNLGLDNAKGEWVAFCDSDDYVYPSWLQNYSIIENESQYDFVCQGIDTDKPLCETTDKCSYVLDFKGVVSDGVIELYKVKLLGYLHNKAFRIRIINDNYIRFDTRLNFREDEVFIIQYLFYCNNIISVPRIGYHYFVPDWSKYDKCDDYLIRFLLYKGYKQVPSISDAIVEKYLLDLVGYIINSYQRNECNYNRLKIIQQETYKDIDRLEQISFLTKRIWKTHSLLLHFYLIANCKTNIKHVYKKN